MKTSDHRPDAISKLFFLSVLATLLVLPALAIVIDHFAAGSEFGLALMGKWVVFFGAGLRLFLAGFRQSTRPSFTAKTIFHLEGSESYPIIRELGFANLCFGLLGLVSIIKAEWRPASALVSGLYYGLAGLMHVLKKPAGKNERFALWTDLLFFALLMTYFLSAMGVF